MHEPEERRKQSETPAYRLEQFIEEERQCRVAHQIDEISRAAQTI
jgi:hypothetical protein